MRSLVQRGKKGSKGSARSSNREVRIRVPTFFSVVYFSRGTPPNQKRNGEKGRQSLGGPSSALAPRCVAKKKKQKVAAGQK